jgi:hypothetical protein
MATTGAVPTPTRPAPPRDDWAASAADTIDRVVTGIGDKTARPLTAVAGAIVFGLVGAAAGISLLVVLVAGLLRLIEVYLPVHPHARAVWITEAGVGGIFTLIGLFVWRKRRPKRS